MDTATGRLTAAEVAYYIDLSIEDLETRLEYSPFKDDELDAAIDALYQIARSYEAMEKKTTTCCQREAAA